jgi:uncharacterized protein (DUF58 family)
MNVSILKDAFTLPGVSLDPDHLLRLRHLPSHAPASTATRYAPTPGQTATRRRGYGIEIDEIRMWVPGDDTRHLDRNATARTGAPHVRTFRDERQRTVLLVADFRPSMLFGTKRAFRSVAAAEALAFVGWRVIGESGRVGLLTVGTDDPVFVHPMQGERAMMTVIAGMARAHRKALESDDVEEPSLDEFMELGTRCLPRGGALILASALEHTGASFERMARSLARRGALRIIVVSDAFEHAPPPGFYPFIAREGHRSHGAIDHNSRNASRDDARLSRLRDLGVLSVRLDAEVEPENNASLLHQLAIS